MEKRNIVGIVATIVVGIALLFVSGCVKKNIPDVKITNTYQLRDISKSKAIQDEAKKRLVEVLAVKSLEPDGKVDFLKVSAYKTFGDHHYLVLDFKTELIGYTGVHYAFAYLDVKESSGKYEIVDDFYSLSGYPDTDQEHKSAYSEALELVRTCGGSLPNTAKAE